MHISELKKAGLSDRQIAVYTALLPLGQSSVQVIARRAKVARGTTYVILDQLRLRGLVEMRMDRHRRLFAAKSPEQLLVFIKEREREAQTARTSIGALLPALHAMMRVDEDRLMARYYKGYEGLLAMRQEMVMYCKSQDMWYNLAPVEDLERVFGKGNVSYPARIKKGIISRTVCLVRSQSLHQKLRLQAPQQLVERKFLPMESNDLSCGLTIFRDRIAVGTFNESLGGMVIESRPLAELLKKFFDIAWQALPS